jgi:hypothetical protein
MRKLKIDERTGNRTLVDRNEEISSCDESKYPKNL